MHIFTFKRDPKIVCMYLSGNGSILQKKINSATGHVVMQTLKGTSKRKKREDRGKKEGKKKEMEREETFEGKCQSQDKLSVNNHACLDLNPGSPPQPENAPQPGPSRLELES